MIVRILALALSLCVGASNAQVGLPFPGPGAASSVEASFTQGPSSPPSSNVVNLAFANTTKTFTGINGGVNFPANTTVIVGFADDLGGTTPGSPQIGGQSATEIVNVANRLRLYQATMPGTSQSDTFSFATAGGFRYTGVILVGYFANLQSTTASATGASSGFAAAAQPVPLSGAITVPSTPAWGVVVAYSVAAPTSISWANTTAGGGDGFITQNVGGNITLGFAHTTTAGSWSPTASGVGTSFSFNSGLVAATWH